MKHIFLCSEVHYVAASIGPKVAVEVKANSVFIITAIREKQHTNLEWHYANKSSLEKEGFNFDVYDITGKTSEQIISDLSKYSAMYVEGGNSYYLLQESQKSGFSQFVKNKVNEGMVYISTSAGSVIAGPDIEPVRQDSRAVFAPDLKGTKGYGLVNFVVMPHWGSEERRELFNSYRIEHMYREDYPYILLTNNQYIEVQNYWHKIIDVTI